MATFQYSCLGNSTDSRAWQATVHGVIKSQTQLSDFQFKFMCIYKYIYICFLLLHFFSCLHSTTLYIYFHLTETNASPGWSAFHLSYKVHGINGLLQEVLFKISSDSKTYAGVFLLPITIAIEINFSSSLFQHPFYS